MEAAIKLEPYSDLEFEEKPLFSVDEDRDDKGVIKELVRMLPLDEQNNNTHLTTQLVKTYDKEVKTEDSRLEKIHSERDAETNFDSSGEADDDIDEHPNNKDKRKKQNNGSVERRGRKKLNKSKDRVKCDECGKDFVSMYVLKTHLLLHTSNLPFTCGICDKAYSRKHLYIAHKRMHANERPFECTLCLSKFRRNESLKKHILTHESIKVIQKTDKVVELFECDYCKKSFRGKDSIQRHIYKHLGHKPIECGFCKKRFGTKTDLKRHMDTHTGNRPFVCRICNIGFVRKYDRDSHQYTHSGERLYNCNICKRGYARKFELARHIQKHSAKEFKCTDCDKIFHLDTDFSAHKHIHFYENIILRKPKKDTNNSDCSVCGKSFTSRDLFLKHLNYFRNKKAIMCKICRAGFSSKLYLQRHEKEKHSGKKLYVCEKCNKSFDTKSHIKRHLHMHTLE